FSYRDNGPGYSKEVIEGKQKNIGIDLIEKLVKGTLRGTILLSNDNGAVTNISIKEEEITRT
ncbi:MAG: hypothetical protein OEV28_13970, partial [Nitrospirota bacterium]|nr:hypothetical protein [Nitrospirota bacterium]